MITTVTGKNQITLPAKLVKELDIQPGTRIDWSIDAAGMIHARLLPSRGALARKAGGMGRDWVKAGSDPIADLVKARSKEDDEEGSA